MVAVDYAAAFEQVAFEVDGAGGGEESGERSAGA